MNITITIAKINAIFLAVVLLIGTFAAVYPSFIIGIQAQSEYDYEYDNNNDSYNSAEYPPSSSEYPKSEYESNYENIVNKIINSYTVNFL